MALIRRRRAMPIYIDRNNALMTAGVAAGRRHQDG